jgi:hypothetical protein
MRLVKDFFAEVDPDEALRERLVEWYRQRPSFKHIEVLVMDRVVILHGRITNPNDRALAIDLALDAGAEEAIDELTLDRPIAARQGTTVPVKPSERTSVGREDAGGGIL